MKEPSFKECTRREHRAIVIIILIDLAIFGIILLIAGVCG